MTDRYRPTTAKVALHPLSWLCIWPCIRAVLPGPCTYLFFASIVQSMFLLREMGAEMKMTTLQVAS